jgi:hypothetical protein
MPVRGPRRIYEPSRVSPFDPNEREPVTISRFAWHRMMERLDDHDRRLSLLEGDPDDAA